MLKLQFYDSISRQRKWGTRALTIIVRLIAEDTRREHATIRLQPADRPTSRSAARDYHIRIVAWPGSKEVLIL